MSAEQLDPRNCHSDLMNIVSLVLAKSKSLWISCWIFHFHLNLWLHCCIETSLERMHSVVDRDGVDSQQHALVPMQTQKDYIQCQSPDPAAGLIVIRNEECSTTYS